MCNWRLLAVIDMQLFFSYLVVRIHISEKPVYSRPLPTKKIGKGPLPVFVFEGKGACKVTLQPGLIGIMKKNLKIVREEHK